MSCNFQGEAAKAEEPPRRSTSLRSDGRHPVFIGFTLLLLMTFHSIPALGSESSGDPVGMTTDRPDKGRLPREMRYQAGGQVLIRGDFSKNQDLSDFSFSPGVTERQILSRTRPLLSAEPINGVKTFVEGQFTMRDGVDHASEGDLYQGYVEISRIGGSPLALKIGRQELSYGSMFFLGSNAFYDGLTWDAIKLRYAMKDNYWMDLIGARFVRLDRNTSEGGPSLYGMYSSAKPAESYSVDFYFFYHRGSFKFFHSDMPDHERWYSLGTRVAAKPPAGFDYEIEPILQFGKIDNPVRGDQDGIRAFGGHLEGGYTFGSKYAPRLFAEYAFGSGDGNPSDTRYEEFHGNIYNDNYLVGDTSLVADLSGITVAGIRASGMHILVAGFSADVDRKVNANLDCHYFVADKTPRGISKNLGLEVNLVATYKVTDHMTIVASGNRFFTQDFFKDAAGSGKDIDYAYLQMQLEF